MINSLKGLVYVLTFLALLLSGSLGVAQARALTEIRASGELRVCFAPIHASVVRAEPVGCRDECHFEGPAYDTVQAFVDFLGGSMALRAQRIDWDEQFFNAQGQLDKQAEYSPVLLESGRCDVYPNMLTQADWRRNKLDIVTMFSTRVLIMAHPEAIATLIDEFSLGGHRAAVEAGTTYHTWLQEQNRTRFAHNPIEIYLLPTDQALERVNQGLADFSMADARSAFWIVRHQYPDLIPAFPVGALDPVGWGIRKNNPELRLAIQQFFEQQRIEPDSALNAIWQRHFGMNMTQLMALLAAM